MCPVIPEIFRFINVFLFDFKIFKLNISETLDYLTNELSKVNDVDEILIDQSKAFDQAPHNPLI